MLALLFAHQVIEFQQRFVVLFEERIATYLPLVEIVAYLLMMAFDQLTLLLQLGFQLLIQFGMLFLVALLQRLFGAQHLGFFRRNVF